MSTRSDSQDFQVKTFKNQDVAVSKDNSFYLTFSSNINVGGSGANRIDEELTAMAPPTYISKTPQKSPPVAKLRKRQNLSVLIDQKMPMFELSLDTVEEAETPCWDAIAVNSIMSAG